MTATALLDVLATSTIFEPYVEEISGKIVRAISQTDAASLSASPGDFWAWRVRIPQSSHLNCA
jgi:hypothetical protein